jgi:Tfp pilus assembly protein PilN
MKNVNFIHTLSPKKQYEIQRWFYLSAALLGATALIMCFFVLPEIYSLYTIKKEIRILRTKTIEHTALLKNKELLLQKNELLNKKTTKINRYAQHTKSPHPYINAITAIAADTVKIEQITLHKKELTLTVLCSSPKQVAQYMEKLADCRKIAHLKLVSLQQDNKTKLFKAIIKGKKV